MSDKVKWTSKQLDAISAREGTILVSAAAGSGKTAVLVERAIERIADAGGTSADRLLIVTFTRAAAAEMRTRIEKRLGDMIKENPDNTHLRRQSIMLQQARIGTVDSFCAQIIREFFHALDVSPEFKIIPDKQREEMMNRAVDESISQAFENGTIEDIADAFTAERDDRKLAEMVLQLYGYMLSHPFPEKWLEEKIAMYGSDGDPGKTLWGEAIFVHAGQAADYARRMADKGIDLLSHYAELEPYIGMLEKDREVAESIKESLKGQIWDEVYRACRNISFSRAPTVKGVAEHPVKMKIDRIRREKIKRAIEGIKKLFIFDSKACKAEFEATRILLNQLANLTLDFAKRYDGYKREKNFLDYNDLEHYALRLFLDENGNRTQEAQEVSGYFDEIMIDEFQDINEVQSTLFHAISNNEENLFMVGDVKQSIYGFRSAMPELFVSKRKSYKKYDAGKNNYPAYVVLDKNFRSRKNITESVNFFFSQLLREELGGVNYNSEEELVYGSDYPEKEGCETQIDFIEIGEGETQATAEAHHIGRTIQTMIKQGFTVTEREGERPVQFRDFTILLRSTKKYGHIYVRELKKMGISAKAETGGGFFASAEIAVMLSFLKIIDHPDRDISLLSVMMSPLYAFTADDITLIRSSSAGERRGIYSTLLSVEENHEKVKRFLSDIRKYRACAATMSADAFISYLYVKSGYADMVLAMRQGDERLSNLRLLQTYAKEYESSGFGGISGFVRFMERISSSGGDLESAKMARGDNAVNIMTMHKSKGLEFPVCFVAGGKRRITPKTQSIYLHPELGLGVRLKDKQKGATYTTMPLEGIKLKIADSSIAEEMRVLYVAMTRAREKLILVSSLDNVERAISNTAVELDREQRLSPYAAKTSDSFYQWFAMCAMKHPDGNKLRDIADISEDMVIRRFRTPFDVNIIRPCAQKIEDIEEAEKENIAADMEAVERIRRELEYEYPYAVRTKIPSKVSASHLMEDRNREAEIVLRAPSWLGEKGMTPAQRGTALHEFMQYADYKSASGDIVSELNRLVEYGFLTQEQSQAVDLNRVRHFFESPIGKRVLKSEVMQRERRFSAEVSADMVIEGIESEFSKDKIILQGAVDCVFEENGRMNIIDFKTDRIKDIADLWDRYGLQIKLYAHAMEQITGKKTGDLILYSMRLNRGINQDGEIL